VWEGQASLSPGTLVRGFENRNYPHRAVVESRWDPDAPPIYPTGIRRFVCQTG
jgi:hypothetical protein